MRPSARTNRCARHPESRRAEQRAQGWWRRNAPAGRGPQASCDGTCLGTTADAWGTSPQHLLSLCLTRRIKGGTTSSSLCVSLPWLSERPILSRLIVHHQTGTRLPSHPRCRIALPICSVDTAAKRPYGPRGSSVAWSPVPTPLTGTPIRLRISSDGSRENVRPDAACLLRPSSSSPSRAAMGSAEGWPGTCQSQCPRGRMPQAQLRPKSLLGGLAVAAGCACSDASLATRAQPGWPEVLTGNLASATRPPCPASRPLTQIELRQESKRPGIPGPLAVAMSCLQSAPGLFGQGRTLHSSGRLRYRDVCSAHAGGGNHARTPTQPSGPSSGHGQLRRPRPTDGRIRHTAQRLPKGATGRSWKTGAQVRSPKGATGSAADHGMLRPRGEEDPGRSEPPCWLLGYSLHSVH